MIKYIIIGILVFSVFLLNIMIALKPNDSKCPPIQLCTDIGMKYMECRQKWTDGDITIYRYKMIGRIEK